MAVRVKLGPSGKGRHVSLKEHLSYILVSNLPQAILEWIPGALT